MNATIDKFGYPDSLVHEYRHWVVLARPVQVTLGSLVLAAKGNATAYGDLGTDAFAEQREAVASIERVLADFCHFEKINYLMLMMVDPHVHFHVIPRYGSSRHWQGRDFSDLGWPGPPDLKTGTNLSLDEVLALSQELGSRFKRLSPV